MPPLPSPAPRTGARLLVDALRTNGVSRAFGVPGESYLDVLDALSDSEVDFVVCRQESGAAMMAEACGKLSGRPGICFVTRGPGATNASAGIHIAQQDSTPMILFVGQISRAMRGREAFQEVDYRAVFGPLAKWAVEIDEAARIPEIVARAFRVAMQGRPGPVVIALPEDVLSEIAQVPDAPAVEPAETWPGLTDMMRLQRLLWAAKRPVMILGGARWNARAVAAVERFAERFDLPVAVSFRRQMLFPADHECFAGDVGFSVNPKLIARLKQADLVILAGGRLGEVPSQGYSLFGIPDPGVPLVHVHADPEELGRVYQPSLAINASASAFAAALEGVQPPNELPWGDWRAQARADYLDWTQEPPANAGAVQMATLVRYLRALPKETIICNGAGNFAIWVHRFHRFRGFGTQLAPTSGSMGYGLPAAVAAKIAHPATPVVAVCGDGDFLMTGQEFATAVQHGAPIVAVVIDNGMYGTIRMHQEREYPTRVFGTTLRNPDFAAYARAFGGFGVTVETDEAFVPALDAAFASGLPSIVHVKLDPEAITPATSLSALRAKALAAHPPG
ncbi:thiamine pyrophosphate-binding protein [Ancylobacter dichloromethanicus]|uniref:Acetolactate synthase large subunit n=1 Tax=Ancylobacter dichloromethanicus TaxID=518825 RepID=A0A9W6N1F6_9HYPH|nr:thiamine pyrophosphate-binding protein [Ancylobacter dichloromethanicus]MBS7552416.1 thiamine pyrophosphate-binding protein [Ancylobacter dichloromethanicus]GLK74156.1 acetolactate synthase large subunit [Ancylobacter dichloromethanicus]